LLPILSPAQALASRAKNPVTQQVLSAAQSLSRDSSRLKLEVGEFLTTVRAA
jgi:hypothetical protein